MTTKAEARAALGDSIRAKVVEYSSFVSSYLRRLQRDDAVDAAIDTFERAAVAEAVGPAAVIKPACPKCGSHDLDERGNCYTCLGRKNAPMPGEETPAPQPGAVMTRLTAAIRTANFIDESVLLAAAALDQAEARAADRATIAELKGELQKWKCGVTVSVWARTALEWVDGTKRYEIKKWEEPK